MYAENGGAASMSRTRGSRPLVGRDLNARERESQALKLRIEGQSQQQIAEALGMSQSAISRAIKRALAARTVEEVDELRALESERLDALQGEMWRQVKRGNVGAGMVIARLMDRRARMVGLDAQPDPNSGPRHVLALYVGLDPEIGEGRERDAVDAAIGAALQIVGPAPEPPRIFVRVYETDIGDV